MNNEVCGIYIEGYELVKEINCLCNHNIQNFGKFINSFLEINAKELYLKDYDKKTGNFEILGSNHKSVNLIVVDDYLGVPTDNVINYYYLDGNQDFSEVDPKIIKRVYNGPIKMERDYNSYSHRFILKENQKNIELYIEKPFEPAESDIERESDLTHDLLTLDLNSDIETIYNILQKDLGHTEKYPKITIKRYFGSKFNKINENITDYMFIEKGLLKKLKITKIKDSKKYVILDDEGSYSYTCSNLSSEEIEDKEVKESIKFLKRTKN